MVKDDTLYRRYLEGDENGLRELLEAYGDALTLYINGYVRDIHDAEDLMIEVFAYLVAKKPAIREGGVKAYMFKAARNLALRFNEKHRRGRCFGFEDLETEPESGELIESVLGDRERDRLLHLCMESLSPDYREALYLVYFEGMSHSQAAAVMKKTPKQIDNLTQRGKKALRTLLEREGMDHAEYR